MWMPCLTVNSLNPGPDSTGYGCVSRKLDAVHFLMVRLFERMACCDYIYHKFFLKKDSCMDDYFMKVSVMVKLSL